MPKTLITLPKLMSFAEALTQVITGQRVTRQAWGDTRIYLRMPLDNLQIVLADGTAHDLVVSRGDITGLDWVIVESD